MAADNKQIARDVLAAVGGASNITSAAHCMTRLRLNLKDQSIPNDDEVKKIKGVLGAQWSGGQYQVIIGQNVPKVYDEVVKMGVDAGGSVDENLDADLPKEKLTPKKVGANIMNYLSRSMVALIPLMMGAGLFKAVFAIVGPDMLNLLPADGSFATLCNAVFNAGFYFMPIYLGYSAAKTLGMNVVLGMLMGGILISPDLVALANQSFDIYGIPTTMLNYSQTVLPILLSVWVMSYVVKLFEKVVPDTLSTIFVPFLTVAVMLPVSLVVLAPLGNNIGNLISGFILSLNGPVLGVIGGIILGGFWEFLVMTGMHVTVIMVSMTVFLENGYSSGAIICPAYATIAVWGMCLGIALRTKNKNDRSTALGCFVSGLVGGVTEPGLYGIGFKFKRAMIGMVAGGAVAGIYSVVTNVTTYVMASSNILCLIQFTGGSTMNIVNGCIASALALVVSTVVTYLTGMTKEEVAQSALEAEDTGL